MISEEYFCGLVLPFQEFDTVVLKSLFPDDWSRVNGSFAGLLPCFIAEVP